MVEPGSLQASVDYGAPADGTIAEESVDDETTSSADGDSSDEDGSSTEERIKRLTDNPNSKR